MKFFTNKSIWSKIIIVLIFVLLFEFVVAKPTLGADEVAKGLEFGGKLLSPVLSLVVTLGDGLIAIAHSSIMGVNEPLLEADMGATIGQILLHIVSTVFAVVVAVGAFIFSGGVLGSILAGIVVGAYLNYQVSHSDATADKVTGVVTSYSEKAIPETLYLPAYSLSPEEIFQGKILLFNVDFFGKPVEIKEHYKDVTDENGNTSQVLDYYYYTDDRGNEVKTSKQDIGAELSSTISKWYVSIRNIALVCMMIVLLYIAIRMLLSTLASDKAKYKQMIQDWLMGMLILFIAHYIMTFSVTLVQKLTDIISSTIDNQSYFAVIPMSEDTTKANNFKDFIDEAGLQDYYINDNKEQTDRDNATAIIYPTNLMGALRLDTQLTTYGAEYVGKAICFLVLVLMTIFFIFTYLRRVLYMAFLTIIAPVVALTYPIDKINDGSAQGFSKWFREYIFNLLIQPMHLLLYYILIASAIDLAGTNVIYSIVAIGFMIPAERLLRNLFGFEKASTPGFLTGAAGGALAMAGINKLSNLGHGRGNSGTAIGEGSLAGRDSSNTNDRPRMNGNVDTQANMMRMAGVNAEKNGLPQEVLDDLHAENLELGDQEANQFLRERGYRPEDYVPDSNQNQEQTLNQQEMSQPQISEPSINEQKEAEPRQTEEQLGEIDQQATQRIRQANIPENQEEPDTKNLNHRQRFARQARRLGEASRDVAINKGKRILKAAPKALPRMALKATTGIAAGTVGVAAGIATGDPSNVASYGGTAFAAGTVAGATINNTGRLINDEDKKVWQQSYYGPKYEDLERSKYIKNYIKEHKDKLGRNFDKNTVKEMTKEGGFVEQSLINGIDDIDSIIAGQTLINDGTVKNTQDAITVMKYHKEVDEANALKGPKRDKYEMSTSKRYQEKFELSKGDADTVAKKSMEMAEKMDKAKKNVHK